MTEFAFLSNSKHEHANKSKYPVRDILPLISIFNWLGNISLAYNLYNINTNKCYKGVILIMYIKNQSLKMTLINLFYVFFCGGDGGNEDFSNSAATVI